MGHFAQLDENNKVLNVIVAEQDFIDGLSDKASWVQTSYNTMGGIHYDPETGQPSADQNKALRKNFACIDGTYDPVRDAFYAPQPFPSWILDEETCWWVSPVPYPQGGGSYIWNEDTKSWVAVSP